jgi:cysteine desulfuration protein SufE
MAVDTIEDMVETFSFLDDWDDRYRYLIELGRELTPYPEEFRDDAHKVQGCVSQVWLHTEIGEGDDPVLNFYGDSDAHIVSGLVAITLALFSNHKASEILELDHTKTFDDIGLQEHLTPQRANGLRSMVGRIKAIAENAHKT